MSGCFFISKGPAASPQRRGLRLARAMRLLLPALMALCLAPNLPAQSQTETQAQSDTAAQIDAALAESQPVSPVPIFSAGLAYNTFFQGGTPNLHPLVSPVVLIPLGQNWLIESRDTFEINMAPEPGEPGYKGYLQKEVDYLQLDYIVNPYVTVTVGRFLTPFGIYNERLYPVWIRDLQSDPLILPISTGPSGAGTGAMARGGFNIAPKVEVNYATYFSTLSTDTPLDSYREFGTRAGVFLPGPRLEAGGSYQHLLQGDHSNAFGFHFAWQPPPLPLDIRAEYARSEEGSGYWVEMAYRLSQTPVWRRELRHVQVVGRMQQFYIGKVPNPDLPSVNTEMFEFGVNYYFRDDLRLVSSYGREFAPEAGNMNVWTVGVTYRLALPVGHGDIQ
ncbi:MAG TPA: hypothetical protein VHX36_08875 [Candidatus Acidoferrales bacterium]|jgi:hypothetical protein|nr:hypothetical protein [Candidatus Acidoferrales bacterium]